MSNDNTCPQMGTAHDAIVCQNSSLEPLKIKGIFDEIPPQHIKAINTDIEQVPSNSNDYTAITTTVATINERTFKAVGAATPESAKGSHDPQALIDVASLNSIYRSVKMAAPFSEAPSTNKIIDAKVINNDYNENEDLFEQINKPKYKKGNRNAPMSKRQSDYIVNLSSQCGLDVNQFARDVTGKELEEFKNADANKVIRALIEKQ